MPLRISDPRLNPRWRPHEWEPATQRTHRRYYRAAAVLLGVLVGVALFVFYQRDRTKGLTAVEVAQAAGRAMLGATGYRFRVDLAGESADRLFPSARMAGEYQREPAAMHLAGEAINGGTLVRLEYYLSGTDLYVKDPRDQSWMLMHNTDFNELHSFQPDNLGAPLVSAVRRAEVVSRERLTGGEAVEIKLDMDPDVMQPLVGAGRSGQAEYRLWVYTRTLRPARFNIDFRAQRVPDVPHQVLNFTYTLAWDFRRLPSVVVPDRVRTSAREVSQ